MAQDHVPSGKRIVQNWWGKSWVVNLERYADYSNRLPRGRAYLRGGAVQRLAIDRGEVTASVKGSRPRPYKVAVKITPLSESRIESISSRCSNEISDLDSLLSGDIPQDAADMFVSREGLFPSPSEIRFSCSCPDSAYMCKHVAAVLYAIGVEFDHDPLLFFKLRGINVEEMVRKSVEERLEVMLSNAGCRTSRTLDDSVFGAFGVLDRK